MPRAEELLLKIVSCGHVHADVTVEITNLLVQDHDMSRKVVSPVSKGALSLARWVPELHRLCLPSPTPVLESLISPDGEVEALNLNKDVSLRFKYQIKCQFVHSLWLEV